MRGWLRTLFEKQYYPAISVLMDTPADRQSAQQWADWMRQQWDRHGLSNLTQQRNLMTEVRRELKDRLGEDHFVLDSMNFTTEQWIQINEKANRVVASRNEQQCLIQNPQKIVDLARQLLFSREWAEIVAGLAVVTGRRCAELLQTATFEPESDYSVWFTGALKRRQEKSILRFEIPTLIEATLVIRSLEKVRTWVDTRGMDNTEINTHYSAAVSKVCHRTYAEWVPPRRGRGSLYTHLFRTIYARIATHWYAPPEVADIEYMAAIQGHYFRNDESNSELRRSLGSTRHYNDYKIGDGQGNIDGRQGIKLGEPGVVVLLAFQGQNKGDRRDLTSEVAEMQELEKAQELGILELEEIQELERNRQRSSLHIYKDEKTRWQAVLDSVPGNNQQQKMTAILLILEAHLQQDGRDRPALKALAEQFVTVLKPLKGATVIRCICQRELLLLKAWQVEEYLSFYQDEIEKAIRAGELPLEDGITAHRDKFIKQGVQYESRTHYALLFLANMEFQVSHAEAEEKKLAPEPVAVSLPTPSSQSIHESEASIPTQERRGRPRSAVGEARVQESIDAIMAYNNMPGRSRQEMWAINGASIRQLRGSNQNLIKRVIEANQDSIDQHHQRLGLGARHNTVHSQAGVSIKDAIQL
ncbi:MAG: hypothetical protein HC934_13665 [Acaryochloridaceae cyanobacterium SU_2_1]|nr:hypothetical protein [Acaryochloridaceae cyanobacterium SU_2_1]NJM95400.1 hypothetical protein [Acaryochloridaceae cyanobacterium CSU_5_19]